jgi:hypothetical protein
MTDRQLDSKAQQEHARENAKRKAEGRLENIIDKKLDGPNRPAE